MRPAATSPASQTAPSKVVIVGGVGGTNIGSSLLRACEDRQVEARIINASAAMSRQRTVQRVFWHLGGRRPVHLTAFSDQVLETCAEFGAGVLLTTGGAPVTADAIGRAKALGMTCLNYSTDDPWSRGHRAAWFLRALPRYDIVFTPRRSNISDFEALGCPLVRFLPFGFDERLFAVPADANEGAAAGHDVLFVGGADHDRVAFFAQMMRAGTKPALIGDYWDRFGPTRGLSLGHLSPQQLQVHTFRAAVNLCLVRRSNRDGHVMRSFEIPACGGFMLAEDTPEHRELFGREGDCVLYFSSPEQAAEKARWALAHPQERRAMAARGQQLVSERGHTYGDRLQAMLDGALSVNA